MVRRNSVWSFAGVRSDLSCKMKVAQDYFSSALSYICNRSRKKIHQLLTNQMPKQKSQLGHLFCFPIGLLGFPEFSLVHFDIHL